MADLYEILDLNEIDGQGKDTVIDAVDDDTEWTKVMIHPSQNVPAGNYDFAMSYQISYSVTGKSVNVRVAGSVTLAPIEEKIDKEYLVTRGVYFFNLSWDGGPFNVDMEMARKGTGFTAMCDFAEFSLKRRS